MPRNEEDWAEIYDLRQYHHDMEELDASKYANLWKYTEELQKKGNLTSHQILQLKTILEISYDLGKLASQADFDQ